MEEIHSIIDQNRSRYVLDLIHIASVPSIGLHQETVWNCAGFIKEKMAGIGIHTSAEVINAPGNMK